MSFHKEKRIDKKKYKIMLFVLFIFPICYLCMYLFKKMFFFMKPHKSKANLLQSNEVKERDQFYIKILSLTLYSKLLDFLYVFFFGKSQWKFY